MAHGHTDIDRLLDDPGYARATAESMQALAAPSRLRIMARLHRGDASVSELADAVGMEISAVSQQLRVLRHLGLVVGERAGRRVVYTLHDDHVGELLTQAVAHVEHVRLGLARQHESARQAVA
ncbi:metalloregulator ArsR/SmtB family transcription factor [Paraconexibacter antarcticus]|uniref:Metalloregulator ArsR/SmtB family transcription factor n=1 Tax=Paraconexibacter antarcticus TaxID=2949664 RepID=A0ABY5DVD5_9ACTN|nr:metalloregulator ArsR/SmtB family transcription factor [Paraconexibacter antarcticus]UTI64889.1 metalloregulator ArsR/SmtB family transcription factor [Paraconexibacter antarcticus]